MSGYLCVSLRTFCQTTLISVACVQKTVKVVLGTGTGSIRATSDSRWPHRCTAERYPVISAFRDLGISDPGLLSVTSASDLGLCGSDFGLWGSDLGLYSVNSASDLGLWGSDLGLRGSDLRMCGSDIGLYSYNVTHHFRSTYCVKYRKYYAVYNSAWLIRFVFISGLCFIMILILYSSDGPAGWEPHTTLNPCVLDVGHKI